MLANKLINAVLKLRWPIVLLYLALAVYSVSVLPDLTFNFSFRQFFPKGDPDVKIYEEFTENFVHDDIYGMVAVSSKDLFTSEKLQAIDKFTKHIEQIEGIVKVASITNIKHSVWKDDAFYLEQVFSQMPPDKNQIEIGKKFLLENELTRSNFVSKDGQTALILIELDHKINGNDEERRPVLTKIWQALDDLRLHFDIVHDGGIPIFRSKYSELISNSTLTLVPLSTLIILVVLIFSFRYWAGVILSISVVQLSLLFTLGLMAQTNHAITIMSTLLPVIILITGVADAVHFHSRYYEELQRGKEKEEAIKIALRHMSLACLLTSFTTAIGFSVLALTSIALLQEFGIFVGIGVMLAYVISITFLPAILAILPTPPERVTSRYCSGGFGSNFIDWVKVQVKHKQRRWAIISVLLTIIAVGGAMMVTKSMRLLEDLSDDHPIIQTQTFFDEKMGGVLPLEIVIEGDKKDAMKSPEALQLMDKTKKFLLEFDEIKSVITTADFIKDINMVMHDNDAEYFKVPKDRRLIAQYFMLYQMSSDDPTKSFTAQRKQQGRIAARVEDVFSPRAEEINTEISDFLAANVKAPLKATITGTWPIAHKVNLYLVDQIFYTFMLAFVVIFVFMVVLFKSFKIALLSMIPNILPLAMVLGVMGMSGINLKPSTAVTFAIAFGIAVDDTIHFITRYISEFKRDGNYENAINRTLSGTGRAIVTTTIILVSGFMAPLIFSEIISNQIFSLLTNVCIIMALFGDLFILPILFLKFRPAIKGYSEKVLLQE